MNKNPFSRQFVVGGLLAVVFVLLLVHFGIKAARAEAAFRAVGEDGTIVVLYREPCALAEIANLKYRATWDEKGKHYEGCWNLTPFGVIAFYMSDRTVFVIPAQMFERVSGA